MYLMQYYMCRNGHASLPIVTQCWDLGWMFHHRWHHLSLMNINEPAQGKAHLQKCQLILDRDPEK